MGLMGGSSLKGLSVSGPSVHVAEDLMKLNWTLRTNTLVHGTMSEDVCSQFETRWALL